MTIRPCKWATLLAIFLCLILAEAPMAFGDSGISIVARFEPEELTLNERGQLVVEVSGDYSRTDEPSLNMPEVILRRIHGAHRMDDGMTHSTFTYLVTPREAGLFSLGSSTIAIDGRLWPIPSSRLSIRPFVRDRAATIDSNALVEEAIRLEVENPRSAAYMGEQIPITISLTVREGTHFRLGDNGPIKVGDGFSRSPEMVSLGNRREERDGQVLRIYSWRTVLTPVSLGQQPLAFRIGFQIEDPGRRTDHIQAGQIMGAMGDIFDGRISWKDCSVESTPIQIEVRPLPSKDRPKDFTGAIGEFELLPIAIRNDDGKADLIMHFAISGTGNFGSWDLFLNGWQRQWQVEGPKRRFETSDIFALNGTEKYRAVIRPKAVGVLKFPPISFSYFNPKLDRYVTVSATVDETIAAEIRSLQSSPILLQEKELPENRQLDLPIHRSDLGRPIFRFQTGILYGKLWFWGLQGLIAYLFLRYFFWRWNRHWHVTEVRRLMDRISNGQTLDHLECAQEAIRTGQPQQFYYAIKLAIVSCIGRIEGRESGVTMADVERILTIKTSRQRKLLEETRYFFGAYEQLTTFGTPPGDLSALSRHFLRALRLIDGLQGLEL